MVPTGANLPPDWTSEQAQEFGGEWMRFVVRDGYDKADEVRRSVASGKKALCLGTKQSLGEFGGSPVPIIGRHGCDVDAYSFYNELDGSDVSSDHEDPKVVLDVYRRARAYIDALIPPVGRARPQLWAPSSVSGDPDRCDPAVVSVCDAVPIHLYVTDPVAIVDQCLAYVAKWGKPVAITEFGRPAEDGDPTYAASLLPSLDAHDDLIICAIPYWPSPAAYNGHVGGQVRLYRYRLGFFDHAGVHPDVGFPLEDEHPAGPWFNDQESSAGGLRYVKGDNVVEFRARRTTPTPVPHGLVYAFDASDHQPKDLTALIATYKPKHVVVKLYLPVESTTKPRQEWTIAQAQSARDNGCTVGGYVWCYRDQDPVVTVREAFKIAAQARITLPVLWLDAETYEGDRGPSADWMEKAAREAIRLGKAVVFPAGAYTAPWFWKNFDVRNSTALADLGLPLWDASYDNQETLDGFVPYGGWTGRIGHQYRGSPLDLDVFDASVA